MFLSTAHSEADIDATLAACARVLDRVFGEGAEE
jgi:glutamate-1-semialdehyde aminotransferase